MSNHITNLSNFTPKGLLGSLFAKARTLGVANEDLKQQLPKSFQSLSLCTIVDGVATFVTDNQALAFRAQQQQTLLLDALAQVKNIPTAEKVVIKVSL